MRLLTERDQVMLPSSGYHCKPFANYTLDSSDFHVSAVLTYPKHELEGS